MVTPAAIDIRSFERVKYGFRSTSTFSTGIVYPHNSDPSSRLSQDFNFKASIYTHICYQFVVSLPGSKHPIAEPPAKRN